MRYYCLCVLTGFLGEFNKDQWNVAVELREEIRTADIDLLPSIVARTPRPLSASKFVAFCAETSRSVAALRMAFGIAFGASSEGECLLCGKGIHGRYIHDTLLTFSERPVLSKITVSSSRACSMATRSRMSIPFLAANDVLMATTSGMASPNACGQEITNTVTARSMTEAPNVIANVHTITVIAADATAM